MDYHYSGEDEYEERDASALSAENLNEMREELSKYLDDTKQKRGYDGKMLISYPKNFDKVSEAMNRKDLSANNGWSAQLFLDTKISEEDSGRYKNIFARNKDENEVAKGFAEIEMLDRQLKRVSKRAATLSESPRSDIGSPYSKTRIADGTFLTRQQSSSSGSSTPSSDSSSPRWSEVGDVISEDDDEDAESDESRMKVSSVSSRTNAARNVLRSGSRKGSSATTAALTMLRSLQQPQQPQQQPQQQQQRVRKRKDQGSDRSSSVVNTVAEDDPLGTRKQKDFLRDNKEAVKTKGGPSLSQEEEERVQLLLLLLPGDASGEEDGSEPKVGQSDCLSELTLWNKISRYGMSQEQELRIQEIDRVLAELRAKDLSGGSLTTYMDGDVSFLSPELEPDVVDSGEIDEDAEEAEGGSSASANTLLKLRIQRSRQAYMKM